MLCLGIIRSAVPLYRILLTTAQHMEPPALFGAFHIAASLLAAVSAVVCAVFAARLSDAGRFRLLSVCGWILLIMEIYKQLFLYFIVNDGVYDWWYFPFQLCSVPMYMCIILPVLQRAAGSSFCGLLRSAILNFLASYTFISAAAALIMPEDFLRPYVSLTLHGFIWHGILLFISLVTVISGMADLSLKGFLRATGLFLVLCIAAVMINAAAEPYMTAAHSAGLIPESFAAMFYLNPYHISPQPVIDTIQKSAGIPLGLALYVSVIILTAGATACMFRKLRGHIDE